MLLPPKPALLSDFVDIESGRNPSYLNSLYLGFERGIFRAPTSLLRLCAWPVLTILMCLGYLIAGLVIWTVLRITLVAQGILGFLRPKSVHASKSPLTGL